MAVATFNQSLTRLRRFLRDPLGDIWEDEDIRIAFNDAQLEIATKSNFVERINEYAYPPKYSWSYGWDWEVQHITGDKYQYLHLWPAKNMIISYPWEPYYYSEVAVAGVTDAGEHILTEAEEIIPTEGGDHLVIE